jgi:hypothetical protein
MLHTMVPASILTQKHEDCLKRLSCHMSVVILQIFTHENSYDLGRDVKRVVSFEVFFKGSDAVSVSSQILVLRKCNCGIFKCQSV